MKCVVMAFGSDGDVLPLLTLAQGMKTRGHAVTVAARHRFTGRIDELGLRRITVDAAKPVLPSLTDQNLLGGRFDALFMQRYALEWNRRCLEELWGADGDSPLIVASDRKFVWADLSLHARWRIPCIRVSTDLPGIGPPTGKVSAAGVFRAQERLNHRFNRAWSELTSRWGFRAGHRHFPRLFRATARTVPRVALWPEWLAGNAHSYWQTRFGFVLPPDATAAIGPTPQSEPKARKIVFVAGTAGTLEEWGPRFARTSQAICQTLYASGTLLGCGLPELHRPYFVTIAHAPLAAELRSASLIVHHGGAGTAATALAMGVPQLLVPRSPVQKDNAEWFRRAARATVVRPDDYNFDAMLSVIGAMLDSRSLAGHCAMLAKRVDSRRSTAAACLFLEHWAQRWYARQKSPGNF